MSYFEDGCTAPNYLGSVVPAPYICPNSIGVQPASSYKTSMRYVQVCSESAGDIVYYHFVNDGHSAVKQVVDHVLGTVKYLSKYNSDGPLVGHDLNGSWYHYRGQQDPNPEFWSYIGGISGNTNIVGTGLTSFSVLNKPEVNYSWSIVSGYSNIYIFSGANQNTVTLKPTHSGTAVLKLSVSSNCASVKSTQITLNIQTNVCLEGTYDNAGIYGYNLNTVNSVNIGGVSATVTCPNATSFTWQKTSGNINGWFPPGASISFTMTSGGSISFLVTAKQDEYQHDGDH